MVKMRRQLEAPGTSQQQVDDDDAVVDLRGVEIPMAAQTPRILWVISLGLSREHVEIPVFGYIPVKGVEGVYEDEKEPE